MDDIAAAAGVGRRSLFRHFESRDALVAEALSTALDWYDAHVDAPSDDERTLEEWLPAAIARVHELHRAAGRGLWQLAAADDDALPAELVPISRRRRANRRTTTVAMAGEAWRRAGGRGACPRVVVDAFAVALSSFATRSMLDDFDASLDHVVECTTLLLTGLVRSRAGARRAR